MSDTLKLERTGHTAVLYLDNPPANTFTRDNLVALKQLLHQLAAEGDIYALVITGSGSKFFSAGADLKQFASGDKALAQTLAILFGEAFEALSAFRGLTIAAINGYAMGGGLECALACDLRIAEEQALLALPEASVGLLPCAGGTQNLPWLVGEGWAKRMVLCGERVDAATALRIGLIEQMVPTGQALAAAMKLAEQAARQSPTSLIACKTLIQSGRHHPIASNLVREREAFARLFDSENQREGVNAFLEKRSPQWKKA
ncbi:enoyl-CoA hydratase [Paludibacterium purpuratum]|uniref:Short chain enoyl-CoA hydratase n=1 Tax=Paludibacterium purpuratum TaxID=1144873 RepID=A0A4V3DVS4_9NEIS|nr:enoyl-CoA hydratase [Paludibacterium purpuratum]TDR82019.1 short chain enoyl-CoA hydratase [Paludibacterium purpuratum]